MKKEIENNIRHDYDERIKKLEIENDMKITQLYREFDRKEAY